MPGVLGESGKTDTGWRDGKKRREIGRRREKTLEIFLLKKNHVQERL